MNAFAALSLALAVGSVAPTAAAQGTLTFSHQRAEAGALYGIGPSYTGNTGITQSFAGMDFAAAQNRSFNGGGFRGKGFAHHGATFFPSNPGLGGQFSGAILDACTSAEIFTSNLSLHTLEESYGSAVGVIEFTLSAPMGWSWIGGWQGNTYNSGAYYEVSAVHELIDINTSFQHVNESRLSVNGTGNWLQNFTRGGVLNPGHYRLTWSHESYLAGGFTSLGYFPDSVGGAPLVSCINSRFDLFPIPTPGSISLLAASGILFMRRRR